jgi:hypothetical protein
MNLPTTFMGYLGLVADAIGVGSFLYVVYRWLGRRLWFRWRLRRMEHRLSARPVALAVGIGTDISGAVERFLSENGLLIPSESYHRKAPPGSNVVPVEAFPEIAKDLKQIKDRMIAQGVTELHLFYRGPVSFSVALGTIFRNWVPIKVYNFHDGTYRLEALLNKDTVIEPPWPSPQMGKGNQ